MKGRKGEIQRDECFPDLYIFLISQLENRTKISMVIEKNQDHRLLMLLSHRTVKASFFDCGMISDRIIDIHDM